MTITIPLWLLWIVGGVATLVILALAVLGALWIGSIGLMIWFSGGD